MSMSAESAVTFGRCFEREEEEEEEEKGPPFDSIVELKWGEVEMGVNEEVWVEWVDDFGGKYFG